jgi:hypothetical protein
MESTRYVSIVRAVQAIAHHKGSIGNHATIMRAAVRLPGGEIVDVPEGTGNAVRNRLRRAAAICSLDAAGILGDPQLERGAMRLLFNGGMLTGKGDASSISIDRWRELVTLFPFLGILGGCLDNRTQGGQLNVDALKLICDENMHSLYPWTKQWLAENNEGVCESSYLLEKVQRVNMDPELAPENLKLLSEGARLKVYNKLLAQGKAHDEGNSIEAAKVKSDMMPHTFERIIRGSLFQLSFLLRSYSDLEKDAFEYAYNCLLSNFRFGGKQAAEHGELEFLAGARVNFKQYTGELDIADRKGTGEMFRAHVEAHKDQLVNWLRHEVAA